MRPVWVLMSAIGVVGANSLLLSPIAADVAASFRHVGPLEVMIASAVYGAGTALSALTLAPRADQIGLQRALWMALAVLSAVLCLSAAAPVLGVLIVAQGVAGLAAGLALPAVYGLAADIAPKGRESETLGKVLTGWTLSLVAGVSLASIISDFFHWRAVFLALGAISAVLAIAVLRSNLPQRETAEPVVSPLRALSIPGVAPILATVAAYMAAFYGLYSYLGAHLTGVLGVSTAAAGVASLAYGVGFGGVAPLDRLLDRFGAVRAAPVVFAILASIYVLLAVASSQVWTLYLACITWGAANHLGLNIMVGQLTSVSPAQRGAILGLYSATTYAMVFVGTLGFKPLFPIGGFATLAIISAICILPAVGGAWLRARRAPQGTCVDEIDVT